MIVDKYNKRVGKTNSLLCVGLDSDITKISSIKEGRRLKFPQFEFNKKIIEETCEHVSSYKLNIAFYESRGPDGIRELKMTIDYLNKNCPDVLTICDAKRADIGNTNNEYVKEFFDWYGFDAVTINPYLGMSTVIPFLKRKDKCSIVLCRTSNDGADEIQSLKVGEKPLWQVVAEKVQNDWNFNNNCMMVVGATRPSELKKVREIASGMTLLVPGVGSQGGCVREVVEAGMDSQRRGLIINSSRGIIFSENPQKEAIRLKDEINLYRISSVGYLRFEHE